MYPFDNSDGMTLRSESVQRLNSQLAGTDLGSRQNSVRKKSTAISEISSPLIDSEKATTSGQGSIQGSSGGQGSGQDSSHNNSELSGLSGLEKWD